METLMDLHGKYHLYKAKYIKWKACFAESNF